MNLIIARSYGVLVVDFKILTISFLTSSISGCPGNNALKFSRLDFNFTTDSPAKFCEVSMPKSCISKYWVVTDFGLQFTVLLICFGISYLLMDTNVW